MRSTVKSPVRKHLAFAGDNYFLRDFHTFGIQKRLLFTFVLKYMSCSLKARMLYPA